MSPKGGMPLVRLIAPFIKKIGVRQKKSENPKRALYQWRGRREKPKAMTRLTRHEFERWLREKRREIGKRPLSTRETMNRWRYYQQQFAARDQKAALELSTPGMPENCESSNGSCHEWRKERFGLRCVRCEAKVPYTAIPATSKGEACRLLPADQMFVELGEATTNWKGSPAWHFGKSV
jgi:hypothetical protein